MSIFHLSHTDLDGYASQFVTRHYFENIYYFNSNYGREIEEKFGTITSLANKGDIVLITDLNITLTQCEKFQKICDEMGLKLFLLDHHQSGAECEENFAWYLLDNSKCATKISYDFFSEIYGKDEDLSKLVRVVDAVDIWQKDRSEFEFGKMCQEVVSGAKEINKVLFDSESRDYIFYLISKAMEYFDDNIALDSKLHDIKKSYFRRESDDTLTNLVSNYVVEKLSAKKDKMTIKFGDKIGILTYNIGSVSVIGNDFLVANPDIDFFVDVTSRKTLSFRANNNADVSQISKTLVGGGGHVNASGGFWASFKDSSNYDEIKAQFEALIAQKLGE